MDNHPIPQDVTGFQFKLVGNMTVKQFAYLAAGIVFSWILYQLPINFLIKLPLCAFSAIFGAGLAFFPVGGRPMDLMIGNFIKALVRPTQFIYEKTGGQIYFPGKTVFAVAAKQHSDLSIFPKDKLKLYLESLDNKPKNKLDEKENRFLMSVSSLATNNYQTTVNPSPNTLQINSFKQDLPSPINNVPAPAPQPISIAKKIEEPLSARERTAAPQPIVSLQPASPPAAIPIPAIKRVPRGIDKNIGLPSVPDSPNLITGITRDPRGNALSNILVEMRDREGNPVRAFKTNELGRFASATPLANGSYTIEFEDPRAQNKFEKISINATGQIILPIEAISVDTREELRRSLFSTGTQAN